jgi:phage/plasmid-like protein (TIGR03299 family)
MAHNLNVTNGKVSMAYTGEKPWHSLGTHVENAMTSAQAIELAGLNYEVEKKPIYAYTGMGHDVSVDNLKKVPNKWATVRKDTNTPLGVVGDRYTVLQNKEAFHLTDALVGIKEAIYHTAGALGDGEIVWILAKLNGVIETVKNDITEKYLLLMNRHDGSGSVIVKWTGIRVVCQNTLNMALTSNDNEISVALRHTASMGLKIEEVRQALGVISAKEKIFAEASKRLATVQLTQGAFKDYLKTLGLAPKGDEEGRAKTNIFNIMEEVSGLFEHGKGTEIPGVRGTLWGGLNAVVEYADFYRQTRGSEENRTKSLLMGSGAVLKQKAWDVALELAK